MYRALQSNLPYVVCCLFTFRFFFHFFHAVGKPVEAAPSARSTSVATLSTSMNPSTTPPRSTTQSTPGKLCGGSCTATRAGRPARGMRQRRQGAWQTDRQTSCVPSTLPLPPGKRNFMPIYYYAAFITRAPFFILTFLAPRHFFLLSSVV